MTTLSVFGAQAPPGAYVVFTDGAPSIRLAQRFYRYGATLTDAATIVGGRVWVPAAIPGATHVRIMLWLDPFTIASDPPARTVVVPLNGTGWHEGTFTPVPIPATGTAWRMAYEFVGNPAAYVFTSTLRANAADVAIPAVPPNGLALSEAISVFRIGTAAEGPATTFTIGYGLDVLVDDGADVEPPANVPPVARAGADRVVASQASVTITGSASTDADGTVASYAWAQTSGPAVILNGAGSARTFTSPEGPAVLAFTLTVTDDDGAQSTDAMLVTVQAPEVVVPPSTPGVGLTTEDLAYMRETQAEHRPTQAGLVTQTETPDGMGGTTPGPTGDPQPIAIRVARAEDVPTVLADRYGPAILTITMDLVTVTSGDAITVSPTEAYEVVSDGAVTSWTTAQVVMAVRTAWPPQGA